MIFGDFSVRTIEGNRFALDGGAMFGIVPKPLWEKKIPADQANRIEMASRSLLIETNSRKILIDTGIGSKFDPKQSDIYKIIYPDMETNTGDFLLQGLKNFSITLEEITDVIITHLHFDHCGGGVEKINGELKPVFPNATYHIQRRNWDWAHHPSQKDGGSYLTENFLCLETSGQLHLMDGCGTLLPSVEVIISEGHTVGQQLVKINGGARTMVFLGDLIPTSAHLKLPWLMAYDLYPITTIEEKKMLLAQALEENWILCFEHDPLVKGGTLKEKKGKVILGEELVF